MANICKNISLEGGNLSTVIYRFSKIKVVGQFKRNPKYLQNSQLLLFSKLLIGNFSYIHLYIKTAKKKKSNCRRLTGTSASLLLALNLYNRRRVFIHT